MGSIRPPPHPVLRLTSRPKTRVASQPNFVAHQLAGESDPLPNERSSSLNNPKNWSEFTDWFHSEQACSDYLERLRWPNGFGKIDDANDAAHHGVAQRDKDVPAAQHQTVDDLLCESTQKKSPIFDRRPNQPGKLKRSAGLWVLPISKQ